MNASDVMDDFEEKIRREYKEYSLGHLLGEIAIVNKKLSDYNLAYISSKRKEQECYEHWGLSEKCALAESFHELMRGKVREYVIREKVLLEILYKDIF